MSSFSDTTFVRKDNRGRSTTLCLFSAKNGCLQETAAQFGYPVCRSDGHKKADLLLKSVGEFHEYSWKEGFAEMTELDSDFIASAGVV